MEGLYRPRGRWVRWLKMSPTAPPFVRTPMCSRRGPHARYRIVRLGSVHLLRGRVTNTREKESLLTCLRLEGRGPGSCLGQGVNDTPSFAKALVTRNWKVRTRGFTLRACLYPARPFGTLAC
ncbi:hypothetical protein CRG98_027837 [Punica granatum]|uniref:Uncharacterized protein n=1 Tax=Punica granatum TaxID=22663 RepID=A0A2I0J6B9_PUNGR|nr:hypothetical protein CRG98_027837 [Punica granatum]